MLEKWMTPSLFNGFKAQDEYSLCQELGSAKQDRLLIHRDKFITKKDFKLIKQQGLNAVRLPVGYWLFGGQEPYVKAEKYVDKTLESAKAYDLQVIIDLHAAPGSQNGYIHSGRSGDINWTQPENIKKTIEVICQIAQKYGKHSNLYGIELLNEPARDIPLSTLQNFYSASYKEVRKHASKNVKVIVSDAYRPIVEWDDFINSQQFSNLILDVHLYQVFSPKDKALSFQQHIEKVFKWRDRLQAFGPQKIIVGEWSAALEGKVTREETRLYAEAQRYAFAQTAGHFYWSYKTESNDNWNYQILV